MAASRNSELQVFSGGLNLRPANHLALPTEQRRAVNLDLRAMNMKPFRESEFIEFAQHSYMFYFRDIFNYYSSWRSNVEWNGTWYWSEEGATGKTLKDGTELPLGITAPSTRLEGVEATPTSGEGLTGDYQYVYTYFDPKTLAESPPSPPSNTVPVELKGITLTGFEPSTVYDIRLYRIGGVYTVYTRVETILGNTATYLDQLTFSEVDGNILDTLRAFPPPTGLLNLTEHEGRFFGTVGTVLYYTAAGKPDSWYALDYVQYHKNIVMLASTSNGLIVSLESETWVMYGNSPIQFSRVLLSASEGCLSPASMAVIDGQAIWLSKTGFMMSNGGYIKNISEQTLGRVDTLDPRSAIVHNRRYIMSFGIGMTPSNRLVPSETLMPGVYINEEGFTVANGAVIIDFGMGPKPVFSTLQDAGMGSMEVAEGYAYEITLPQSEPHNIVMAQDRTYQLVTERGTHNIVVDIASSQSLSKMFEGEDFRKIEYRSPVLTENSIGVLKQYEKVRVTFAGTIVVTVWNDDDKVLQSMELTSIRRTSQWVGIPVASNRGYGIQFEIVGHGVVDSILYTWTPTETL